MLHHHHGANLMLDGGGVASSLGVTDGRREDFFAALANLHTTVERMISRRQGAKVPGEEKISNGAVT
jgi:hypothetical protein